MLSVDVRLEAEITAGENQWMETGNFIRMTGESAKYRAFYTFSSTIFGVFDDVRLVIELDDAYGNIANFFGVILPTGATYQTSTAGTVHTLTVNLGSQLPAGLSGYIEFQVQSKVFVGPDGELIPSNVTFSGTFVDGATSDTEPFLVQEPGPNWQVQAENRFLYRKTVRLNGGIWVPDSDAYIIEYALSRVDHSLGLLGIGSWGYTSVVIIDTLPTIAGVTPEVLTTSSEPHSIVGNVIRWEVTNAPLGMVIRVRYPKDQIDAIGGIAAVGEITNHWDLHFTMIGGVTDIIETEATHVIEPVPPEVIGSLVFAKYPDGVIPFPGNGLYYNEGEFIFRFSTYLSGSNIIPDAITITDEQMFFTFEDDTTQVMTGEHFFWDRISGNPRAAVFEYATNVNPSFVVYPGIQFPTGITQAFPPSTQTEYVTQWRITMTGTTTPGAFQILGIYIKLLMREFADKRIKSITNLAHVVVQLPGGGTVEGDVSATLPFHYDLEIHYAIRPLRIPDAPIAMLGGEFTLEVETFFADDTSVDVYGRDLCLLLPPGLLLGSSQEPAEVIEDFEGSGKTLVRVARPSTVKALEDLEELTTFQILVAPSADLGQYRIEAYYAINQAQASDSGIALIPVQESAADVYDLDGNGNRAQMIPYRSIDITVATANLVNVLKMSKGLQDPSFQVNNDTQITGEEHFFYKFFVRNDSSDDMAYVTIIDIFPYVGDQYSSQWAPRLVGIPEVPPYITVSYSLSTTPSTEPIFPGGTGEWSTVPPDDISLVRALKFDFGDAVFAPGESAEILLSMAAPEDAPDMSRCYNSVMYLASAIDANGHVTEYLPAFSPPAYARLTFRVFDNFVGDFVWWDINENGLQDPGEPGINGVTVQLLGEDGEMVYSTVTGDHPVTGEPGYYAFSSIWPATYTAHFPILLEDGKVLTVPRVGDPARSSTPQQLTGLTNPIVVEDASRIDTIDAGFIDQRFPTGKVGDFVWHDENGDGMWQAGETGINGVLVTLIREGEGDIASTITGDHPITGEPGYYEFGGIAYGRYQVRFPTSISSGRNLTIQNAGTDDEINSKPNPQDGLTDAFMLDDETPEVLTMDAGYHTPPPPEPAFIGDFIFQDLNENGIQEPGEPGINGVRVELYDEQGNHVLTATSQNHPVTFEPGFYSFVVPAGTYYVRFPTELDGGQTLTIQNAGSDPERNSKPDPATGNTEMITVAPGEERLDMDAGYIIPVVQNARLGDRVWLDENENGLQDPGEPGINGVSVMLYDAFGTLVATTTTEDHPDTGEPGYYAFDVDAGAYYVHFPTERTDGATLTEPNVGSDPSVNSHANQQTGNTQVVTVSAGEEYLYLDAGYIPPRIPPAIIGDFVWLDENENGLQDPGEPGINGVLVELYTADGVRVASMHTRDHPSTGEPGYYEFEVEAGSYYVQFPVAIGEGQGLTVPGAGDDPSINSKPDVQTGRGPIFTVAPGESMLDMDAGYLPPFVPPVVDIEVTKHATRRTVAPCECITFVVRIRNLGNVPLESIEIVDRPERRSFGLCEVEAFLRGQRVSVTATRDPLNLRHHIALDVPLAPGETITLRLCMQASDCVVPGCYRNTVHVTVGGEGDWTAISDAVVIEKPCKKEC